MKSYRINFWEGSKQYTTVVSATDLLTLRESFKSKYDRFTIEEIK